MNFIKALIVDYIDEFKSWGGELTRHLTIYSQNAYKMKNKKFLGQFSLEVFSKKLQYCQAIKIKYLLNVINSLDFS